MTNHTRRPRAVQASNPINEDGLSHFMYYGGDDQNITPDHPEQNEDEPDSNDGPHRVYTPLRGELDDVPNDYELNFEGFRFTAVRFGNSSSDADGEPTVASLLMR